jgi:hypothetical protein
VKSILRFGVRFLKSEPSVSVAATCGKTIENAINCMIGAKKSRWGRVLASGQVGQLCAAAEI